MKIPLPCGRLFEIDDQDFPLVSPFKWGISKKRTSRTLYVKARIGGKTVHLHRWLLDLDPSQKVDHIDGNGLNNTRSNLRIATQSQNMVNAPKISSNTSGFKGVHWNKKDSRWRAEITVQGKCHSIGSFKDATEAAKAYDLQAIKFFGEFAKTNILPNPHAPNPSRLTSMPWRKFTEPPPPPTDRTCPMCKTTKPLDHFYKGKGYCKPCQIAYTTAYQKANLQKVYDARKRRQKENREKATAFERGR